MSVVRGALAIVAQITPEHLSKEPELEDYLVNVLNILTLLLNQRKRKRAEAQPHPSQKDTTRGGTSASAPQLLDTSSSIAESSLPPQSVSSATHWPQMNVS